MNGARSRILILGADFAGPTTARRVAGKVGDRSDVTVIDRKSCLPFIPNIPREVWNDKDPEVSQHLSTMRFFEKDGSDFVQIPRWGLPMSEFVADRSPV